MRATSGAVTLMDELVLSVLWLQGLEIPRPPRRTGRANSSRSVSLNANWPVRDGKNRWRIAFSRGSRRSLISGIVLKRYVHLLVNPCVNDV